MAIAPERKEVADEEAPFPAAGIGEVLGIFVLGLLAVFFLHLSWRKWPDPIVDVGPQWYAFWRVAQGAVPYHDFLWNYGPLSACLDGLLFRCFGPGMMVLVTANFLVYGVIVTLAYLALRRAWGWLAAWAAVTVFISVFSFSILNAVGNYNFATPYAQEATHGFLLMLVTLFVVARWSRGSSLPLAFVLGFCGGLAAVLKPEFMLAGTVLGIAALLLRYGQGLKVSLGEYGMLLAGLVLPTIGFAAWFARTEAWSSALVDASQAWWLVLVKQRTAEMLSVQPSFLGLDKPWPNIQLELIGVLEAVAILGLICAVGRLANQSRWLPFRFMPALMATALALVVGWDGGWFHVGRCFPGLMLIGFILAAVDLWRERHGSLFSERTRVALLLVLLGGTMMARMFLRARVDHFGFFQASMAGMVVVAIIVAKVPAWTGAGMTGQRVTLVSILIMCWVGCWSLAMQSLRHRADQTQPVGSGADLFYADAPDIDETGFLVNWLLQQLRSIPPDATLLVLPEGFMINYLSRHRSPRMPELQSSAEGEDRFVRSLAQARPDYVIWLTRDMSESGIQKYGAPGGPGAKILSWVEENYVVVAAESGRSKNPKNATLLRRKDIFIR